MRDWKAVGAPLTFALAMAANAFGQGGPPMVTDDTGTPGKKSLEMILSYATQRQGSAYYIESPRFDFGYGITDAFQVLLTFPWASTNQGTNGTARGFGDTTCGCKWRFFDQGDGKLAMSTAPQFTFNTTGKAVEDGLVGRDASVFLPVQFTHSFGPINANLELSYSAHRDAGHTYGVGFALGHEIRPGLDVAAELYGTYSVEDKVWSKLANVGVRYRLGNGRTFLASVGKSIGHFDGDHPWMGYVGLQFAF